MKNLFKLLCMGAIAYVLCGVISACSEEADCSMVDNRGMMVCNFYTIDPNTGVSEKAILDSLTVTARGTDSVIINRMTEVSSITLPLRYTADSTELIFRYTAHLTDTLVIRHTNTPYFVSMDCGYQMKQSIAGARYTRRYLDSLYVSNSETSINGTENIQLFY